VRHTTPRFLPLAVTATVPVALAGGDGEKKVCQDRGRLSAWHARCILLTASS
jgi:hypothetical protein